MNKCDVSESDRVQKVFLKIIAIPFVAAFSLSLEGGLLEIGTTA